MTKKKITTFSKYNLWDDYADAAKEILKESGMENPTDNEIWGEIYNLNNLDWNDVFSELKDFFDGGSWILFGTAETWTGRHKSGTVFTDFANAWYRIVKDCDGYQIYDENGHLYIECTHHDGVNRYEIKKLTEKGIKYYENWENGYCNNRSERYIHDQIVQRYSVLPRYWSLIFQEIPT